MIRYKEINPTVINEVKEIFRKESWNAYLRDDEKLVQAYNDSLFILGAFDESKLVGLIRCIGDDKEMLFVKDLIVDPEYQKRGIGTYLFQSIMKKYENVKMFIAVTDINDKVYNKFYQSFNLKKLNERDMIFYIR